MNEVFMAVARAAFVGFVAAAAAFGIFMAVLIFIGMRFC